MMIELMYHSAMRISELINLKVKDVDFNKKEWTYGRTFLEKRKRKGESYCNIDRDFVHRLEEYRDKYNLKNGDYWFTSSRKKPYTQGGSINTSL